MPTYAPDFVVVPCKTGTGATVNLVNAALYGKSWKPQPFLAAGIVQPELWGQFTFGPAYVGNYYREQWYIENQNQPLVYTLLTGSLPPGLSLTNLGTPNTAEGQIDGTPTTVGTYNFTLHAAGPTVSGDKSFTIVVNPATGGVTGGCGGG